MQILRRDPGPSHDELRALLPLLESSQESVPAGLGDREKHYRVARGHIEVGTVSRLLTEVAAQPHQQPIRP